MWSSLEGTFVGGRYEIQRHIATGGMAAVFRAWDHRVERPVAVKVLRQLENADRLAIARFQREAHATAMLDHPNVVRVYDFFKDDGCYYLAMELVEGINLKQHLRRHGPLPAEEALGIAEQICRALEAAHANGFIHRDIKPQNVLLDLQGVARLTDFGIVHVTHGPTLTTGGLVLGTADYIAPEQARGEPLTPASDLYGVGVVLYEMLTGRLPFIAPTPVAVATLHATAKVVPPSHFRSDLSRYVEAVVLRSLQKAPERRYQNAAAMGLALRRAQGMVQLAASSLLAPSAPTTTAHGNSAPPAPASAAGTLEVPSVALAAVGASAAASATTPTGARVATSVAERPADHWQSIVAELLGNPLLGRRVSAGGAAAFGAAAYVVTGDERPVRHQQAAAGTTWTRALVVGTVAAVLTGGILGLEIWLHLHGGTGLLPLH
jgi:tRNA A-37 threonylcarbamoyl transferase component Bud32